MTLVRLGWRDEQLVELYRDKDKAQCARLAEEVSVHIARQIAPWVDGYYLITPFARVGLIGKIIAQIAHRKTRDTVHVLCGYFFRR